MLAWTVDADGVVEVRRLDDGRVLDRHDLFEGRATAWAFGIGDGRVAFGFGDGSIREASVSFGSALLGADAVPESFRSAGAGAIAVDDRAVLVRLGDGQVRKQWVSVHADEPVARSGVVGGGAPRSGGLLRPRAPLRLARRTARSTWRRSSGRRTS